MEVKGVINVSRRVNEGLKLATLAGPLSLTPLTHAWHSLDPDGADRLVNLPDAQTLLNGWSVVVHHNGNANTLTVRDAGGNVKKAITAPAGTNDTKAYQFVLIDGTTVNGVWKVIELGDPVVDITKYVETFVEADWSVPSGDLETLEIEAATHGRGVNPMWQVQDDNGSKVYCHDENVDTYGNILLTVTEGDEFDGAIVVF